MAGWSREHYLPAGIRRPASLDRRPRRRSLAESANEIDVLTSSAALKGRDSSRDLGSRCWFAVHGPGNPEASPVSHGMPCRGSVPGDAGARLVIADSFKASLRTDILEEVERRVVPGLETGAWSP